MFLEISQNSQENTCARVSFLIKLQALPATLLKKRLWHRCFPVTVSLFVFLKNEQKQPTNVFYKKRCFKNFAKFAAKQLCHGLFFNNVAGLDSGTSVFLWILRNFSEHLFHGTPASDWFCLFSSFNSTKKLSSCMMRSVFNPFMTEVHII